MTITDSKWVYKNKAGIPSAPCRTHWLISIIPVDKQAELYDLYKCDSVLRSTERWWKMFWSMQDWCLAATLQEQGMMSTVGSLGALLLWGIDEGLTQIDKCPSWETPWPRTCERGPKTFYEESLVISHWTCFSSDSRSPFHRHFVHFEAVRKTVIARYQWSSDVNLKVPKLPPH